MVECYGKGVKASLLVANSIIFVSGAALLALGVWTVSDRSFVERLLGISLYVASAVALIIAGTIVCVISLLGSLGAYKELKSMLKAYFCILAVLSVVILAIGSLGFVFRSELDEKLQREMQLSMKLYGNDSRVTDAWDSLQISFGCCGLSTKSSRGFESWRRENPRFGSPEGPQVPESCCRSREDDQTRRSCLGRQPRKEDTYLEGCYDEMKSVFRNHSLAIGLVATLSVLFIAVGLVLSGILYIIIRRKDAARLNNDER